MKHSPVNCDVYKAVRDARELAEYKLEDTKRNVSFFRTTE